MSKPTTPSVPWGMRERALSLFSPRAAARSYAGKVSAANLRRSYEGGAKTRLTDGWKAGSTAADTEIAAAGAILRDRMRDLVRNNSLAANAVQVLVSSMVGPGIRPRANTGDKALDKKVDELFARWSKKCDAHGHTDFHGLVSLAVREMVEGGEVFAIKRPRRKSRMREVPLEIEIREADHLDAGRWSAPSDPSVRVAQGIEYDQTGRRSAYWMFPDHPGDNSPSFRRNLVSQRVPAAMVAHLFERQRVQSRGVPWGTPALRALQDLGDWQLAEMVRKKTEACMVGIVFGEDGDGTTSAAPTIEDANGNPIEQFEPGMFAYARNGKEIKFNTPSSAGGTREWNVVQMHLIAAGFRVPYALLTGDLKEANFSSSRVGINEFRRMVDSTQWLTIIPMLCQKIWDWFTEAAWTAGLIPSPDIAVEWSTPKFESVNPWQDAQTDLLETRAGFTSLADQIAKRGYNAEDVLREHKKTLDLADTLELVLDSDPRKVSRQGLAQANTPGEAEEPPAPPPPGDNEED
ncbi:phage portal protein [Sulfitobacter sp. 1A12126]|uniref:phage portal protein n=1 Tax=Sulfitobacter sp. 1A12126 TaxID=3368591 RepID=UPI0037453085